MQSDTLSFTGHDDEARAAHTRALPPTRPGPEQRFLRAAGLYAYGAQAARLLASETRRSELPTSGHISGHVLVAGASDRAVALRDQRQATDANPLGLDHCDAAFGGCVGQSREWGPIRWPLDQPLVT